ncbi:hypothetical protein KIN20_014934 [Parelaphostrongylus tenuis]|uniref:Uncharacterized protein n=1 Tax=Parelaphostrongylus tenuis TaxID=148309 RepID=A0AAD5MWN0_PARTN|nr:hypothetical protein KIN20_014934 [Parelaphostrongylus tenuis]
MESRLNEELHPSAAFCAGRLIMDSDYPLLVMIHLFSPGNPSFIECLRGQDSSSMAPAPETASREFSRDNR